MEQDIEPGTFVKTDFFSFNPKIGGKVYWVDTRTLEFRPDQKLESGQIYDGRFRLDKLIDVPDEFKEFPVQFQIIKQNFRISNVSFDPYSQKDLKYNTLQGEFTSADFIDNSLVEKIVSAKIDNNDFKIKWSHDQEAKKHTFTIDSLTRIEADQTLIIAYNGKSEGIDAEGE